MRFLVDLLKPLRRDVGVNLCGGEVGVTEEFLHAAQVGAGVEHVRGEAVA